MNENTLRRAYTERKFMKQIVGRQWSGLGHVLSKRGMEYQVVKAKAEGKGDRGRERHTFLGCVGKCLDKRDECYLMGRSRTMYHAVTANVRI